MVRPASLDFSNFGSFLNPYHCLIDFPLYSPETEAISETASMFNMSPLVERRPLTESELESFSLEKLVKNAMECSPPRDLQRL